MFQLAFPALASLGGGGGGAHRGCFNWRFQRLVLHNKRFIRIRIRSDHTVFLATSHTPGSFRFSFALLVPGPPLWFLCSQHDSATPNVPAMSAAAPASPMSTSTSRCDGCRITKECTLSRCAPFLTRPRRGPGIKPPKKKGGGWGRHTRHHRHRHERIDQHRISRGASRRTPGGHRVGNADERSKQHGQK